MWNPLKTLRERDSALLRDLRKRVGELEEDVEQCIRTGERINAKLRARARRAGESASNGDRAPDDADDNRGSDVSAFAGPALVGQSPPATATALGDVPVYTKDQLRGFARQRGLRV